MAKKEAMMNRAEADVHKAGGDMRGHEGGAKGMGSDVENETKADMKGAFGSNPGSEKNPLKGARNELHEQHPIHHGDRGPHHGTDHHIRHMPLHGMTPHGYGR